MAKIPITRTALLDGDVIAYKASFIATNGDVMDLEQIIEGIVAEWMRVSHCQEAKVCMSGVSFRYDIFPEYKAHRKDKEPPLHLDSAKAILNEMPNAVKVANLEADDVMGILATNGRIENPIIVSIDKDMRNIPGWHCNPDKDDFPVRITPSEAELSFCLQWLTGDPGDGYPGLPGIGPVKALKLLDPLRPVESVVEAYESKDMDMAYCLTMARLARILDVNLWDSITKKPILWSPEGCCSESTVVNETKCQTI